MTLGQKIKKLRNDKGLTQKDLADQVHVTFQTVSKWENDENEPDVSTLRELAKLFGCSLDYLLSEEETPSGAVVLEEPAEAAEPVTKTIIIHQKELHVCRRCGKDIPENELAVDHVCVRSAGRGHSAEYRDDYYHKECLQEVMKERAAALKRERETATSKAKKRSFGWGIAGGVVALVVTLLVLLINPECQAVIHPGIAVLLAILAGYGIFSMLYCIISGSYIGEVFLWCASASIKFPGLIFSWDIDGIIWVIAMKILFAIIAFLFGVFMLMAAIGLSAFLGMISFPFVLVHNIHTGYSDAL